MADFAPNYTCRIRIRYLSAGRIHTQQWRCPIIGGGGAGAAAAVAQIQLVYDAISGGMPNDWAVLSTSVCAENTSVFLPFAGPVASGSGGVIDPEIVKRAAAQAASFVGRSASGNRAIEFFYGYIGARLYDATGAEPDDFRVYAAEDPIVAAVVDVLNTSPALCANDGEVVLYNSYANLKENDYWVRKSRQGA